MELARVTREVWGEEKELVLNGGGRKWDGDRLEFGLGVSGCFSSLTR